MQGELRVLERRFRRDLKRHKDLEQAPKVEVQKGSGQVEEVMSMFGSEQQAQAVAEATYIAAAAGVVGTVVEASLHVLEPVPLSMTASHPLLARTRGGSRPSAPA